MKTWNKKDCIIFFTAKMPYFELSNMYHKMPIRIGEYVFNSSEALYQACKYPKELEILPKTSKTTIANVRERILKAKTPMQAKMTQKCAVDYARANWDSIKDDVMLSVLVLKLNQHEKFKSVLLSTLDKPIVEQSRKDTYWGAIDKGKYLEGENRLGLLLMQLRDNINYYTNEGHTNALLYLQDLLG